MANDFLMTLTKSMMSTKKNMSVVAMKKAMSGLKKTHGML